MICTQVDDFINDKDSTYWIIKLSDGQVVYQDDDRNNSGYAWLRLKDYCEQNNVYVVQILLKFRSNTQLVFNNDGDGVFWRLKVLAFPSSKRTHHYQLFGIIKNNQIHVYHWRCPELIMDLEDDRPIDIDCDKTIIWNKKK